MLVSSVIDRVILQLADDLSDPTYLSRSQILQLINHCNKVLTEQLDAFTKIGWIRCVANKPKYTLDPSMRTLKWVTYNGKPLEASTIQAWAKRSRTWRNDRGTPTEYAIDVDKRHVIWLWKCPGEDGDQFIFDNSDGVPYAIVDPYSVSFTAQTQDFTIGATATGGSSGATGTILYVEQDGYSGKLYFESDPGSFTDGETITDSNGGSATANGTTVESGGNTWTFTRSYGLVTEISGGDDFWDLVDTNGEESSSGIITAIWSPVKNIMYRYSYYPEDLAETDHLLHPYYNSLDMYLDFCMWHALMIEAEGQDLNKAALYAQGFAAKSGIELTKIWTPQREFTMGSFGTDIGRSRTVKLPDDYGPVEY